MARRRRSSSLNVLLNGRHVGSLNRAANGAVDFRYAREWLDWDHALPVSLSLPLADERYTGARVTAVFDNLLPDNEDIRRRIAERVGADGADAYNLLAAVGRDCVGALQFLEEGVEPKPVGTIEAEPVTADGAVRITFCDTAEPANREFTRRRSTRQATPPWRRIGSHAW